MTPDLNEENIITIALDWILKNSANARNASIEITATTNLLEEALVDSLGFVDLLTYLESSTGKEIDLMEIEEDDLSTLEGISGVFMAAGLSNA